MRFKELIRIWDNKNLDFANIISNALERNFLPFVSSWQEHTAYEIKECKDKIQNNNKGNEL